MATSKSGKQLGYVVTIIMISAGFFFAFYFFEYPIINNTRNDITFRYYNSINNGSIPLKVSYNFDMDKGFLPRGNISDNYRKAIKCPSNFLQILPFKFGV